MRQKEIGLLPFPFTDLERTKVRPAVVISNDFFNNRSEDCIMVPLTTVLKNEPHSIEIDQKDLNSGRLIRKSRIRADKIFSVEKRLIKMRIGSINDEILERIKDRLSKIF